MCFYHILHKNSISHLLRPHRILFGPPKVLEKKWKTYFIIFVCTFSSSICCVYRTLSKIWLKNIDFYHYSYTVGGRAVHRAIQRAVVTPPLYIKK